LNRLAVSNMKLPFKNWGRGKLPMVTIEIAGYQDEISNPNEFFLLYTYFGLCLCIAVAVGNSFRRKNIYHIHIIHCKVSPLPFFHGQYFLVYFGTLNHFFFFTSNSDRWKFFNILSFYLMNTKNRFQYIYTEL
jgi:hypothetical protein